MNVFGSCLSDPQKSQRVKELRQPTTTNYICSCIICIILNKILTIIRSEWFSSWSCFTFLVYQFLNKICEWNESAYAIKWSLTKMSLLPTDSYLDIIFNCFSQRSWWSYHVFTFFPLAWANNELCFKGNLKMSFSSAVENLLL